jgi:outer membrane protein OmpA-like peptidoglycan-associated protein
LPIILPYLKKHFFILLSLFGSLCTYAQRVGVYTFEKDLTEKSKQFPTLGILGNQGELEDDLLPELDNMDKKAYVFEKNSGLQFDNKAANGFLDGNYTIEIYFRFTKLDSWKRVIDFKNRKTDNGCYIYDGKLNFYNYSIGDRAPVKPNEYTHYVVSRNVKTKQMKMYVDGLSKIEFTDKMDEGVVGEDGVLNFFHDDLIVKDEASAGAVALIKIYDYIVDPVVVKSSFKDLEQEMQKILKQEIPPIQAVEAIRKPNKPKSVYEFQDLTFSFEGHIQNALNKKAISQVTFIVLDSNMIERDKIITNDGNFKIEVKEDCEYNIIVEALGFFPVGVHLPAKRLEQRKEVDNVFALEPVSIGQSIGLKNLKFAQSKADLLPESNLELNKILTFLKDTPTAEIELHGHTDNQGDFDLNLQLSRQRAEAVKIFLVQQGIQARRISCKGFGGTRPVGNNRREESREQNRRVELVVRKY